LLGDRPYQRGDIPILILNAVPFGGVRFAAARRAMAYSEVTTEADAILSAVVVVTLHNTVH
jgi:hypothetical protein